MRRIGGETFLRALTAGLLWAALELRAAEQGPSASPPPPAVTLAPAARYPRAPWTFNGIAIDAVTERQTAASGSGEAAVLGTCGDEIELTVRVSAQNGPRSVKVSGRVTDDNGVELQAIDTTVAVKAGTTETVPIRFKPEERNPGPFHVTGTWSDVKETMKGDLALAVGQANARFVVEDFERLQYVEPGQPMLNSERARHSGQMGLEVHLNKNMVSVPLNIELPGRPAKIGVWVKAGAPVRIAMRLHDPGVAIAFEIFPDWWTVGPVDVATGDWIRVELPVPGYGKPKAQRRSACEANGAVDYPLTLVQLDVSCAAETTVCLDDVEAWTQTEPEGSLGLRLATDKPLNLLYRNDTVTLMVCNGWLWKPSDVTVEASLDNIRKIRKPLVTARMTLPPGAEQAQVVDLKGLSLGPYRLAAEMKVGEKSVPLPNAGAMYFVYEPAGKPLPAQELHRFLRDRESVLAETGLRTDILLAPWHSVDGSASVEPSGGVFDYGWFLKGIHERRAAGHEVIGMLGFTPLWASPDGYFNRTVNAWYGGTTRMPSRSIYWEEYVRRTVEACRDSIDTWVVWDRPDSEYFAATPEEYVEQMLEVAHKSATRAKPDVKLISGAIARDKIETFLPALAEAGIDRYVDGIGIYPSTAPLSPEDGFMDVVLARAQRVRKQEEIRAQLWALDLAWPTGPQNHVSELEQALYLPRAYVLCRAQGVDHIILTACHDETHPVRDSADLIYRDGSFFGIKPAAISARVARQMLDRAAFLREVFLADRWEGLSRGYLFKTEEGRVMLVAWRREGQSVLTLPQPPLSVIDSFGNAVTPGDGPDGKTVTLGVDLCYALFDSRDVDALARALERRPLQYEDAPESAWKREFTFQFDVGNAEEEKAAGYAIIGGGRRVGPIDSFYHNEYGQHVVDSGRHFTTEESFSVDVSGYGDADLLIRKRINYAVPNQSVMVYCNGEPVGQWFAYKRDRRYRWRDIEFIIPSRLFKGEATADLRFEAMGGIECTSYYYWAGPLRTRTLYISDKPLLVGTSGWGHHVNRDKNILGGPLRFFKRSNQGFPKGIGTNAAGTLADSLIVLSLNKQFKRFKATVGVDAAADGQGTVRFRISDGTRNLLFDSGDMNYYTDPKDVDIDVSDSILLLLWVDDTGDGDLNDLADWAAARLEVK